MSTLLTVLLALLAVEAVASLLDGLHFHRRCRRLAQGPPAAPPQPDPWPRVALLVPCKGREPGLERHLRALAGQDYPELTLWLITATRQDGAAPLIERLRDEAPGRVRWHVAGLHEGCAEKVAGLRSAVRAAVDAEVLVTADSDGEPDCAWLRRMVARLPPSSDRPTAVTGYRWYVPARAAIGPCLQSAWNAAALSLLDAPRPAFTWGGATAIRRPHLEATDALERWRTSASDDYSLTRALRAAGGTIRFAPECLVRSRADLGVLETLWWVGRQLLLTRVYAPRLWWTVAVYQGAWSLVVLVGAVWLVLTGSGTLLAWALFVLVVGASMAKGGLRWDGVRRLLPGAGTEAWRQGLVCGLLAPLTAPLTAVGTVLSAATRRLRWRGVVYTLDGPERTRVLARRP